MSGPPPAHSNLVGRNTDALPSNQSSSWHSSRDPGPGPNSANSDPQSHSHSQSQSQSYGAGYGPNSFDTFMPPIGSQQSDILNQAGDGAPGSGTDPNRLNKKRQRDDHEELDPHPDSSGESSPHFCAFFQSHFPLLRQIQPFACTSCRAHCWLPDAYCTYWSTGFDYYWTYD